MSVIVLAEGGLIDPQPGLAIWTLITFVVVAAFLKWKVWGPLMQAIDGREESIRKAVDQARFEREAAQKLLAEQQELAAKARAEAAELVRRNRAEIDAAKADLMAKAKSESESLLAAARKQIDDDKRKAVAELRQHAVELSLAIAGKVVAAKLDDAAHLRLAEEFIGQVGPRA
jgi:F-type H+-transporting ATPase subunit b